MGSYKPFRMFTRNSKLFQTYSQVNTASDFMILFKTPAKLLDKTTAEHPNSKLQKFYANKESNKTLLHIPVFSLFSIVTFKNTGCRSQSSLPSGQR